MSLFNALRNLSERHRFGAGRLDGGGDHGFRQRTGTSAFMTDQQPAYAGFPSRVRPVVDRLPAHAKLRGHFSQFDLATEHHHARGPDAHVAMLVVQRHLLQGLFLGFAQLYNTLHRGSGAMGSPKLTKFKPVYQQNLTKQIKLRKWMNPIAEPLKFAYWVPNVSGGLVVSKIEQRTDWGIDYNRRLAQLAEQNGFDYALSQIRFTAGYGAEYQHESVAFSHALLAATKRLKVIAAILPGPWHPAVVAKQLATIDQMNQGRVAINVVSGWFKGEFTALGEPWLEHDERYRRSEEFIRAIKGIWTQDNFTFKGDFYRFNDYTLKPKPLQTPHPEVFQGGNSAAARRMAAAVSDWYFMNGNTPDGHRAQIDEISAAAEMQGRRVRFGVNAFIIARDTEDEAHSMLDEIIRNADTDAVNAFGHAVKQAGKAAPEGQGMWANSKFEDLVQYNDGFKTNLIGTPEQIAQRIVALKEIGVNLILAGFLHYHEEVEYFGKRVLPLVRERT